MSMRFLVCRSDTGQTYSSMGQTRVLCAVSFSFVALICEFFLRRLEIIFVLELMLFACSFELSCWMVAPDWPTLRFAEVTRLPKSGCTAHTYCYVSFSSLLSGGRGIS